MPSLQQSEVHKRKKERKQKERKKCIKEKAALVNQSSKADVPDD